MQVLMRSSALAFLKYYNIMTLVVSTKTIDIKEMSAHKKYAANENQKIKNIYFYQYLIINSYMIEYFYKFSTFLVFFSILL